MKIESKFNIVFQNSQYVYIEDIGLVSKSVTNDAEAVLLILSEQHNLGNRRLIYCDSGGQIDEILHDHGKFKGFSPGHQGIDLP